MFVCFCIKDILDYHLKWLFDFSVCFSLFVYCHFSIYLFSKKISIYRRFLYYWHIVLFIIFLCYLKTFAILLRCFLFFILHLINFLSFVQFVKLLYINLGKNYSSLLEMFSIVLLFLLFLLLNFLVIPNFVLNM